MGLIALSLAMRVQEVQPWQKIHLQQWLTRSSMTVQSPLHPIDPIKCYISQPPNYQGINTPGACGHCVCVAALFGGGGFRVRARMRALRTGSTHALRVFADFFFFFFLFLVACG